MNRHQDTTFEIAVLKAATKEVVGYIGAPFPKSELVNLKSTIATWNLHHEVNARFPQNFDGNLVVLPEPYRQMAEENRETFLFQIRTARKFEPRILH